MLYNCGVLLEWNPHPVAHPMGIVNFEGPVATFHFGIKLFHRQHVNGVCLVHLTVMKVFQMLQPGLII